MRPDIFMRKPTHAASRQGIGGGLHISAAAAASLDADTLSRFFKSVGSTSNKDIFGSYVTA